MTSLSKPAGELLLASEIIDSLECVKKDLWKVEQEFSSDIVNLGRCMEFNNSQEKVVEAAISHAERLLSEEASKCSFLERDIEKNNEYSENLRTSIDVLLEEESKIKNEFTSCQKSLGKAQKHLKLLSNERTNIEELKNVVRIYQVLTKTTFAFSSKGVKGVTMTKNGPKAFDFPKDTPQNEIVENLWKLQYN